MKDYTKTSFTVIWRLSLVLLIAISLLNLSSDPGLAQTTYPEYIVVYGDTLSWIALRFDTTVEDIQSLNGLDASSGLHPGDRLKIPTLAGMQGILTTEFVPLGSSLTSLSRRSQAEPADLIKANKLTSPSELLSVVRSS